MRIREKSEKIVVENMAGMSYGDVNGRKKAMVPQREGSPFWGDRRERRGGESSVSGSFKKSTSPKPLLQVFASSGA